MTTVKVSDVIFEHYAPVNTLGVHDVRPRISWRATGTSCLPQAAYQVEIWQIPLDGSREFLLGSSARIESDQNLFNPWPLPQALRSRQRISVRVKIWLSNGSFSDWSAPSLLETGLLLGQNDDWKFCQRIRIPWNFDTSKPNPEALFRTEFTLEKKKIAAARLYITSQGVYEAEINGTRVGDHFMAPGWTDYDDRLQYQTYDVTSMLEGDSTACLGVRLAEGWYAGRLGFNGGQRDIWGAQLTIIAQLEIHHDDGNIVHIGTDESWMVAEGPIRQAEIYDGEKYDARLEIDGWSNVWNEREIHEKPEQWKPAVVMPWLSDSVSLVSSMSPPVRRIITLAPASHIITPSGKTVVDFGQNLVGYVRVKNATGVTGERLVLHHAEVLENGELGVRPLRKADATDEYTFGNVEQVTWEPRFTFHGFRYVQIDGWISTIEELLNSLEAVVCHTDMAMTGDFCCSDKLIMQLFHNIRWSMRGNFFSVPTDCPQRDERLGYTGDFAIFAPTACFLYNCFGAVQNWLADVRYTQRVQDGVPAIFAPNPMKAMGKNRPCAIWGDVTIIAPWTLFQAFGDSQILEEQYDSMVAYLNTIPKNSHGSTHLWESELFQLGDWLDPTASADKPWKGSTDAQLVANAFLVYSLDKMRRIAEIVGKGNDEVQRWTKSWQATHSEFIAEYVTPNGRVVSDSQTAYALVICLDILTDTQLAHAGARLANIVRRNDFKIGTGFAGTPFVCEALVRTGHDQVAYAMLLNTECPSWLYPVTMGATTIWERWDSLLPDGSVNPGEMTSFNHYAFGAIGVFIQERVVGLKCMEPGWRRSRVTLLPGGNFNAAAVKHDTPYGLVSASWALEGTTLTLEVTVPPFTIMEIEPPDGDLVEITGGCEKSLVFNFPVRDDWPAQPINNLPIPEGQ